MSFCAIANLSISTLKDGSPTYGSHDPMDWKCAPVFAGVMARAKFRSRPSSLLDLASVTGPVGELDISLRLYDFTKVQNQRASDF